MPNTYTQIHVQIVFAVKHRQGLLDKKWGEALRKYMTQIIQHHGHKLIIINTQPDHVHILIGLRPDQSLSELVKNVKQSSSKWINENKFINGHFEWQQGFGAFSYSKSHLKNVIKYIENQDLHHKKSTFKEEYIEILKKSDVDFDEKYIFHDPI